MSDFAGQEYDFAAGSTKGLRSWNIDHLGRLHGVTHQEVWVPGENVSVCKATTKVPCTNREAPKDPIPKLSDAAIESKPWRRRRKEHISRDEEFGSLADWERDVLYGTHPRCGEVTCRDGKHTVPTGHRFDPDCQCGFWAYDESGFKAHGSVVGVIEGYGKTTVGTKGFRCEKARIVGLSMQDGEGKALTRSTLARLANLYPDVVFAESMDALIDAHPEVLRSWDAVDEGFWLRPVPEKDSEWWRSIAGGYYSGLSWSSAPMRFTLGGGI